MTFRPDGAADLPAFAVPDREGELIDIGTARFPHAHRRLVHGVGRLLCITTPGGFENFFRTLAEAAAPGEPPETAYARASERAGITWLD